jgi:hypothetical protein
MAAPLERKSLETIRTEGAHFNRIRRFILSRGRRHSENLRVGRIEPFLTPLARRKVAESEQNRALTALPFPDPRVLEIALGTIGSTIPIGADAGFREKLCSKGLGRSELT